MEKDKEFQKKTIKLHWNKTLKEGEKVYLISSQWFQTWKEFVQFEDEFKEGNNTNNNDN